MLKNWLVSKTRPHSQFTSKKLLPQSLSHLHSSNAELSAGPRSFMYTEGTSKLFTSSGHEIPFARGFSLQVSSAFGIQLKLKFTSFIFEMRFGGEIS